MLTSKSMPKGGKRPGAGRPKGDPSELTRQVSVSMYPAEFTAIEEYAQRHKVSRSAAIESAIKCLIREEQLKAGAEPA